MVYDSMGLSTMFIHRYIGHALFTNLRWEKDEYNFFRERREKGAREAFHEKDDRFSV
jgi:enoyl-CoA hydratase